MTNSTPSLRTMKIEPIGESRLSGDLRRRIDAWIAAQPEPRAMRAEAIRSLVAESLGKQETAAPVAVGFPTAKSEALLRAAILAFADEIADAPDDFEEFPGEGAKDYEAKVRQAANSPYIDEQSLIGFIDNELHRMNKMNTVASPRKK
jgi:hypothetical protein